MKIRLFLVILAFSLPMFVQAGNKKIGENTWQGTASYYHNMFEGRKTANGDIFRQKKLTGANNFLPLGTYVRVTNIKNGKTVIVKVNDRMNKRLTHRRLIDLSRGAAQKLGFINAGLAQVKMEVLPNYKKDKKYKKPKKEEIIVKETDTTNDKSVKVDTIVLNKDRVFKFPAWAKIILKFEEECKVKTNYVAGALRAKELKGAYHVQSKEMEAGKSYQLVLLSRATNKLQTLDIVPLNSDGTTNEKIKNYAQINLKPKDDNFIFFFSYEVPQKVSSVQFVIKAEPYVDASEEDFALFVFDQQE